MIKLLIQKVLHFFSVELRRIPAPQDLERIAEAETQKKFQWLIDMEIQTILDIGANTGQFATAINKVIPDATLYSFEPLTACYEELVKNLGHVPHFYAFNIALGNETGKAKIYCNEYSPSSSLLPMAKLHKDAFPHTRNDFLEETSVARLDDISKELTIRQPLLIKVDVQGFEDKVIAGGLTIFNQANVVIIEMSTEQLYESQILFDDIYRNLVELGFQYHGNYEQLRSPNNGKILQVDGIFLKK